MYLVWLVLFVNAYDPTILRKLFANDALFNKLIGYLPGWTFALYRDMEKRPQTYNWTRYCSFREILFSQKVTLLNTELQRIKDGFGML